MALIDDIKAKVPADVLASRDTDAITAAFNEGRVKPDHEQKYTSLGISEKFPDIAGLPGPLAAEMVFQKLEGFATVAQGSADQASKLLGGAVARQMAHLKNNGMAIGSPAVAAMLDVIVKHGGLTQEEADALKGVANKPDPIDEIEVRRALWSDAGEYLA